jgi:hypothetical protein
MKSLRTIAALALGFTLAGCGASQVQKLDGTWDAQLFNTGGTPALTFTAVLAESGGTQVDMPIFALMVPSSCFPSETSRKATFTRARDRGRRLAGTIGMTVTTKFPVENNLLTLKGEVNDTLATGTWSLTGGTAPCNGSGSFQMNRLRPL